VRQPDGLTLDDRREFGALLRGEVFALQHLRAAIQ
jgi:hypothetical protein